MQRPLLIFDLTSQMLTSQIYNPKIFTHKTGGVKYKIMGPLDPSPVMHLSVKVAMHNLKLWD